MSGRRITVSLDPLQAAWVDALASLHNVDRATVLRNGLSYLAARESVSIARSRHYAAVQLAARAQRWDPISDYIAGRPISPP